ncbi:BTB POZ domain-containing 2 [Paramuricea clavata]|nr:BTB POZ domain-containing 2 [Paramuricea clavata]
MSFINGQTVVSLLAVTVLQWQAACVIAKDMKGSNSEWRLTKLTLLERNSFMFNNSLMSDVKFVPRGCGTDEPIYAHKYILATSSPVFYELFYGESAKRTRLQLDNSFIYEDEGYIVFEEDHFVEPVVSAFLRFLYKEECPENIEYIVRGTRDMAKQYRVPSLETACIKDLELKDTVVSDGEWQLTKTTLLSRSSYMFNNPLMSDIIFWSEGRGVYAHRYILATSSPVFYTMFYGESDIHNDYIYDDFDEEIIAAFLSFLYKEVCPKYIETVLKVLALVKKYRVQSFETTCKSSLEFNTPWPAFKVIEKFLEVDAEEMAEPWWTRIESQLDEIIVSEYFLKISQRTLIAFLERDTLCYPEIDLFHAVVRWSEYQCRLQRMWVTVENQRKVLGDSIFRIRFLSMTEGDFKRHVVPSGVLTDNEVSAIIETMRSGVGNYNYNWALPARSKRAWFCQFYSVEQLQNRVMAIVLGALLLVACVVFMHVYPYLLQIYEEIQETLQRLHCSDYKNFKQEQQAELEEEQKQLNEEQQLRQYRRRRRTIPATTTT